MGTRIARAVRVPAIDAPAHGLDQLPESLRDAVVWFASLAESDDEKRGQAVSRMSRAARKQFLKAMEPLLPCHEHMPGRVSARGPLAARDRLSRLAELASELALRPVAIVGPMPETSYASHRESAPSARARRDARIQGTRDERACGTRPTTSS